MSLEVITTLAPVETRLAENPPSPRSQINAECGEEALARRRDLPAFVGEGAFLFLFKTDQQAKNVQGLQRPISGTTATFIVFTFTS